MVEEDAHLLFWVQDEGGALLADAVSGDLLFDPEISKEGDDGGNQGLPDDDRSPLVLVKQDDVEARSAEIGR